MRLRRGYDRVYKPTRYFRQMLSYEEVQRRLNNHYGGKLTIVEYNGMNHKGILHCKECGTFETKNVIRSYISTSNIILDCELCTKKRRIAYYQNYLNHTSLEIIDYHTTIVESVAHRISRIKSVVVVKCNVCGESYTIDTSNIADTNKCRVCAQIERVKRYTELLDSYACSLVSYNTIEHNTYLDYRCNICGHEDTVAYSGIAKLQYVCVKCREDARTKAYKEALSKCNCTYLDYYRAEAYHVILEYKCNICGTKDEIRFLNLIEGKTICNTCKQNAVKDSDIYISCLELCKSRGRLLLNYNGTRELTLRHLFCGREHTSNKRDITRIITCKHCYAKTSIGTLKDHNKHLVEEYLIILYNVQKLKNFFMKHNQLQNIPQEPRTILEHIDGWINNYETIIKKYPNGDLGTVLENNPLYEKCRKVFYPIMDKYGIERIKDLGGK